MSWWRHQMGKFSALLALCSGNSPVTGEFPSQRPVTRSFDVSFDLHQDTRLIKQSTRRWFVTPSRSLWRHYNGELTYEFTHTLLSRAICGDVILRVFKETGKRWWDTLMRKCQFDEIFITGCTGSCHFDNFQCNQWWKFRQNEDNLVSVYWECTVYWKPDIYRVFFSSYFMIRTPYLSISSDTEPISLHSLWEPTRARFRGRSKYNAVS